MPLAFISSFSSIFRQLSSSTFYTSLQRIVDTFCMKQAKEDGTFRSFSSWEQFLSHFSQFLSFVPSQFTPFSCIQLTIIKHSEKEPYFNAAFGMKGRKRDESCLQHNFIILNFLISLRFPSERKPKIEGGNRGVVMDGKGKTPTESMSINDRFLALSLEANLIETLSLPSPVDMIHVT